MKLAEPSAAMISGIPDDLFFAFTRPKSRGGVNPGRDLLADPEVVSRACDSADMYPNLFILYALAVGANARQILEIGTSDGTSTLALLKAACEVDGHVTSIDISDVPVAEALVDRFGLRPRWTFLHGDSHDVLPAFRREKRWFDLILVDGDHTYAGALRDVEDCAAMLKWDGILLFHDSNMMNADEGPGCGVVPYRLLRSAEWQGFILPFDSDLTLLQRRSAGIGRLERCLRQQTPEIAALAEAPPPAIP